MASSLTAVDIIDLDYRQCEGNVDNDEYKKEYHYVQDHVGHTDDNWTFFRVSSRFEFQVGHYGNTGCGVFKRGIQN